MLERLAGNDYYCFLDGFSGYFQIPIDPRDQEKTTFTCPYGRFAYRRMPFGLCNAPGTFQRCMMAIIHDMIEKTMEIFMDDFLVFGNSFENCLSRVDKMLQRSFAFSLSWDEFAVRVQCFSSNPSPPFALHHSQPWMGCFGLCDFARGEGYRGNGLWEMVRGSWEVCTGVGIGSETVGKGGLGFGGKRGSTGVGAGV
ncbi:reverse transcriptase domain-containing protein [Tanacetum coccineum]